MSLCTLQYEALHFGWDFALLGWHFNPNSHRWQGFPMDTHTTEKAAWPEETGTVISSALNAPSLDRSPWATTLVKHECICKRCTWTFWSFAFSHVGDHWQAYSCYQASSAVHLFTTLMRGQELQGAHAPRATKFPLDRQAGPPATES